MRLADRTIVAMIAVVVATAAAAANLQSYRATYEKNMDDIILIHGMKLATLGQGYTKALDLLSDRVTKAGDLNKVKAVLEEIERFSKEHTVSEDNTGGYVDLKRAKLSYIQKARGLETMKARKMLSLTKKYDIALLRLQKSLTTQRKLDDATAVQKARDTLQKSNDIVRARALVAEQTRRSGPEPTGTRKISTPRRPKGLSATPDMRGQFKPSTRQRTLCLTFEKGVTDKIKRPPIQWTNVKTILDGRFGKGCALRGDGKLAIGPVKIPDKGTFALWVRISKNANIAEQMRIVDSNGLGLYIIGAKLHAHFNDGKSSRIGIVDAVIGEWMHLAVTWGGGEKRFFVNGELHSTTPYAGKPAAPVRVIHIGCRWTGTEMFLVGDVDEILMYDRCLSPDEIATISAKSKK